MVEVWVVVVVAVAARHLHAARLLEWAVLVGVAGEELDERQRRLAHDGGLVGACPNQHPHAVEPHELGTRGGRRLARRRGRRRRLLLRHLRARALVALGGDQQAEAVDGLDFEIGVERLAAA